MQEWERIHLCEPLIYVYVPRSAERAENTMIVAQRPAATPAILQQILFPQLCGDSVLFETVTILGMARIIEPLSTLLYINVWPS